MKSIQYKAFGHSDVLQLTQTNKPTILDNEVLTKIVAITVNPLEMKIREGYLRQVMPLSLSPTFLVLMFPELSKQSAIK